MSSIDLQVNIFIIIPARNAQTIAFLAKIILVAMIDTPAIPSSVEVARSVLYLVSLVMHI